MRRGKQSATNPLLPAKLQRSFLWTLVQRTAHSHQLPQGVLTWESFTVPHTWGEGHPSVSGNWLSQRKSRWITYFQLMPWKEDQSCWNQKRNIKKKKKKTSLLLPIYRGENSTLSFYGSRVEVRLQTPAHHDLRSRQDLQKEISNWYNCSQKSYQPLSKEDHTYIFKCRSLLFCGLIIMVFYVGVQNSTFEEYLNITLKNSCLDMYTAHSFLFLMEDFLYLWKA